LQDSQDESKISETTYSKSMMREAFRLDLLAQPTRFDHALENPVNPENPSNPVFLEKEQIR